MCLLSCLKFLYVCLFIELFDIVIIVNSWRVSYIYPLELEFKQYLIFTID
jgi:hypothetical protein